MTPFYAILYIIVFVPTCVYLSDPAGCRLCLRLGWKWVKGKAAKMLRRKRKPVKYPVPLGI